MNQTLTYGTQKEGIHMTFEVNESNQFAGFTKVVMTLNGIEQPISALTDAMAEHLKQFCQTEIDRQLKYKKLTNDFAEVLGERIIITNEREYENAVWEFNKKTEFDTQMVDLNN